MMIVSGVFFIFVFTAVFFLLRIWLRRRSKIFYDSSGKKKRPSFAFFHPYCNAGGGGERVLWVAVRSIQRRYPNVQCVIYTGDVDATPDEILARASQRFNIFLPSRVEFVFLRCRGWVEASKYPYFTLLGQSIGSVFLGLEALYQFVPDAYIDTMGYAFTLPLFRYLGGSLVACYVHYPTISTDMLDRVTQRVAAHNNASFISSSPVLSRLKIFYYQLFAYLYGVAGNRANVIMVNSTWTYNHIISLWGVPGKTHILYPPCDISEFMKIPLDSDEEKSKQILSLGQFRPEKDHPLQIRSFSRFVKSLDEKAGSTYKLVLAGSCRNEEDQRRVESLHALARELGVDHLVDFRLNIPFSELKQLLAESLVSLHTMWNEHFGICVVEGMAAGTVMLAHDSGGPKMDIVVTHNDRPTGFLASDEESFAAAMKQIFQMSPSERLALRQNARDSLSRFSEEEFDAAFLSLCRPVLKFLST
ncbi:GDP-Man:Man(3)GlcNAc(2)-PP-Dol alpha-1,2-mannosyltransferase isoform X2 [Aplysia californica]|nr:GDP-Man:Man(3)GlcNAc(2)-PP-Dol alpha-1,2-mannosyltransferase isoform X2 [Aplysia californica]